MMTCLSLRINDPLIFVLRVEHFQKKILKNPVFFIQFPSEKRSERKSPPKKQRILSGRRLKGTLKAAAVKTRVCPFFFYFSHTKIVWLFIPAHTKASM